MMLEGLIKYYDRKKDKERIKELEEENTQYKIIKEIIDNINEATKEELYQAIKDTDSDFIHSSLIKEIIEKLNRNNKEDTESVKKIEAMRRDTTSDFYKKSYQTSIHKLNAKREVRTSIMSELEDLLKGE